MTVTDASGVKTALPRLGTAPPTDAMMGAIAAMALYAGTGVDAVHGRVGAAAIVKELTDGLDVS